MLRYLGLFLFAISINVCLINSATLPGSIRCSVPRCEAGCHIEKLPSSPCPGCVCKEGKSKCPTCDQRYFKHYIAMQCKPVYEDGCDCPLRFDCPGPIVKDPNTCLYNGVTYTKGQSIPTSNRCEICSCQTSYRLDGGVEMSCIPIECPSVFRRIPENCYEVYEEDKCCPVDTKCDDETGGNVTETCTFEGKSYHLGTQMYSEEDQCLTCLCTDDYIQHGKKSKSCKSFDCPMERHISDFNKGCVPIYHVDTCCPIENHCPTGQEEVIHHPGPYKQPERTDKCMFNGKAYDFGTELNIHHPTNCVTCSCQTPPDFTCVHQSCTGPPNDDYQNCRAIYTPGACCAKYECKLPQLAAPERS